MLKWAWGFKLKNLAIRKKELREENMNYFLILVIHISLFFFNLQLLL